MRFKASVYFDASFDMAEAGVPIIIDGKRYLRGLDGWRPGVPLKPSILDEIEVEAPNERAAAEAVFAFLNSDNRPNGRYEPSLSIGDVVLVHSSDADVPFAVRFVGMEMVDPFQIDEAIIRH